MNDPNSNDADIRVLAAGFSRHSKRFHTVNKNGHPCYLIRLQTEGYCRASVNRELKRIGPGDLLLYPANEYYELLVEDELQHDGKTRTTSADYYIFFRGTWANVWWNKKPRPVRINTVANQDILNLIRQIAIEQRRTDPESERMLGWYMKILCVTIDRAITEQPGRKDKTYLAYRIRRYIEENATSSFRLADVARHLGISVSGAVHLFKQTFGQSMMRYALELRLTIARERILFSTMPLEYIAEISGFASYTYFHRMFRARYGMSPRQYRKFHGGGT